MALLNSTQLDPLKRAVDDGEDDDLLPGLTSGTSTSTATNTTPAYTSPTTPAPKQAADSGATSEGSSQQAPAVGAGTAAAAVPDLSATPVPPPPPVAPSAANDAGTGSMLPAGTMQATGVDYGGTSGLVDEGAGLLAGLTPAGPTDLTPSGAMPASPATATGESPTGWSYSGTGYVPPTATAAPDPFVSTYAPPTAYQGAGEVPTAASEEDLLSGLSVPERAAGYTPTASSAATLNPQLQQFISQWLANPNRYTSDLMKGRLTEIDQARDAEKAQAQRDMDAYYASRGITGGSPEWVANSDLLSGLDRNRLSAQNDLLSQMAGVEAGDRSAAFNSALGYGNFLQGQDAFNANENRYGYDTGYRSGRDYETDLLNRVQMARSARAADNASLFGRYDRTAQAARDAESGTLNRAQLGQARDAFDFGRYTNAQGYGLNRDQLAAQVEAQRAQDELARNQMQLGSQQYDTSRADNLSALDWQELISLLGSLGA